MTSAATKVSNAGTPSERELLESVPTGLYVDGEWRQGGGGATFDVEDPATGETLASVADATPDDGRAALDAAVRAQAAWGRTPPRERSELLRRVYETITERAEEFALLMTLEMGKPLVESRGEVAYAADFIRWYAEEAVRIDGRFGTVPNGSGRLITMRQPVGPCLMITPWNFPLAMGTRKIGPAVAAGCTMIVKPAEQTPLSMLLLAQVFHDCGLPAGVLNVLATSDAAALTGPLFEDDRLRKVSFTGSTEVGRVLLSQAAGRVLKTSMELGGNAPFLVFDDADLDAAVDGAMIAKMRNMGEACTAANRFLVASSVAQEFTEKLAKRMGSLKIGRGTEDDAQVGPLIDDDGRAKVTELVDDAVKRGASVLCGGEVVDGAGHFFQPTVLADVPSDARITKEEVFGPVAPVVSFDSEDEAVALANDTEFGLVAYLYTRDIGRALRMTEALETGMVGVNQGMVSNAAAPFGGIKQSGLGREGGPEGIGEYLETKYAAVNLD